MAVMRTWLSLIRHCGSVTGQRCSRCCCCLDSSCSLAIFYILVVRCFLSSSLIMWRNMSTALVTLEEMLHCQRFDWLHNQSQYLSKFVIFLASSSLSSSFIACNSGLHCVTCSHHLVCSESCQCELVGLEVK